MILAQEESFTTAWAYLRRWRKWVLRLPWHEHSLKKPSIWSSLHRYGRVSSPKTSTWICEFNLKNSSFLESENNDFSPTWEAIFGWSLPLVWTKTISVDFFAARSFQRHLVKDLDSSGPSRNCNEKPLLGHNFFSFLLFFFSFSLLRWFCASPVMVIRFLGCQDLLTSTEISLLSLLWDRRQRHNNNDGVNLRKHNNDGDGNHGDNNNGAERRKGSQNSLSHWLSLRRWGWRYIQMYIYTRTQSRWKLGFGHNGP